MVSFAASVAASYLLFAKHGLPYYGIRTIAVVSKDFEQVKKTASEIFTIIAPVGLLVSVIYIFFVKAGFHGSNVELLLLSGMHLPFAGLDADWFHRGMDGYKYAALRAVFCRTSGTIAVFLLLRKSLDYPIYAAILSLTLAGVYFVSFIHLKLRMSFNFSNLELKRHIPGFASAAMMNLVLGFYAQVDILMLGYLSDNRSIGLYSFAVKLIKTAVPFVTAMTGVLLARAALSVAKGNDKKNTVMLRQSMKFTLFTGLPLSAALYFLAEPITSVFAGERFMPAVEIIRLMAPLILLMSISHWGGHQIFFSSGRDKIYIFAILFGIMLNVIFSFLLVPSFSYKGSAWAFLLAESMVIIFLFRAAKESVKYSLLDFDNLKYLLATVLMSFVLFYMFSAMSAVPLVKMLSMMTVGSLSYLFSLYLMKEKFISGTLLSAYKGFRKNKS